MKPRVVARHLAAIVVSLAIAFGGYKMESARHSMGKDAFLASQAQRFDEFYAKLHPTSHFVGVGAMLAGACLAGYELLALGFQFALSRWRRAGGV